MTDQTPDRRAELIAAALAQDLTPDERAEFASLRESDPTIDDELMLLGGLPAEVRGLGSWREEQPSDALRDRIDRIADDPSPAEPGQEQDSAGQPTSRSTSIPRRSRTEHPGSVRRTDGARRRLLLTTGAAACVAVGLGLGVALAALQDAPVDGPPGTLGALETVEFVGEPSGVHIAGDVVAHTWGTETVLRADGLPTGGLFAVIVIDEEGREFSSGTLLGSDIAIDCRLNAAVLREDAVAVEIRGNDGTRIATAALAPVDA
ncbi:hypothetical protein [Planctomonas psychrotolerans]|uniref:hypothetical protein n=1 Tax=Planctomonas psychrotolerans TaxID=2528712 RepID=UPI001239C9DB|nr:hypothetical protein [Planctomonas psychrotolerans]